MGKWIPPNVTCDFPTCEIVQSYDNDELTLATVPVQFFAYHFCAVHLNKFLTHIETFFFNEHDEQISHSTSQSS